jgi:hypothetical protein
VTSDPSGHVLHTVADVTLQSARETPSAVRVPSGDSCVVDSVMCECVPELGQPLSKPKVAESRVCVCASGSARAQRVRGHDA